MEPPESRVHSFIVKLWLEEAGDQSESARWHGYITHVPSGERRYLQELCDIVTFVKPYVAEIGSGVTQDSRPRSWFKSWTRKKQ